MYKRRLKQWGLNTKYNRGLFAEVLNATLQQTSTAGSPTVTFKGKEVDPKEVQRYLKRKNLCIDDIVQQVQSGESPHLIASRTQDLQPQTRSLNDHPMTKDLLYWIGCYVCGMVEAVKGLSYQDHCDRTQPCLDAFDCLSAHSHAATLLLDDNRLEEATMALQAATASIQQLVLDERPQKLGNLLMLFASLCRCKHAKIVTIVLEHLTEINHSNLPQSHPFLNVCERLLVAEQQHTEMVISTAWQYLLDSLAMKADPSEWLRLVSNVNYIALVEFGQSGEQAEGALRQQVHEASKAYGEKDWKTLECIRVLAETLVFHHRDEEAFILCEQIIASAQGCAEGHYINLTSKSHLILSEVCLHRSDFAVAELHLWKSIEALTGNFAWPGSRFLYHLVKLELLLRDRGETRWACEIRQQRLLIFAAECQNSIHPQIAWSLDQ